MRKVLVTMCVVLALVCPNACGEEETLFESQIEWMQANFPQVREILRASRQRTESRRSRRENRQERSQELQAASSTCSETQFDGIVARMSFCTDPFLHWTGFDFDDKKSVKFACDGVCAADIESLTTFEKNCLNQHSPIIAVIFANMCKKEDGQYCGEPYAILRIFSDCPSVSQSFCSYYGGCTWSTSKSLCAANYKQTLMEKMCTKCLDVLFKAFGTATGTSNTQQITTEKALDTICLKEANSYCMEKIHSDPDLTLGQKVFLDFSNQQIAKICTTDVLQCFMRFHSLNINWYEANLINNYAVCREKNSSDTSCGPTFQWSMHPVERSRAMYDNMCTTKENASATTTSTFCLSLPNVARNDHASFHTCWGNVLERPQGYADCASGCPNLLLPYLQSWGCCAGSIQTTLRTPHDVPLPDESFALNYTRLPQSSPGTGGMMNLATDCNVSASSMATIALGYDRCKASFATFSAPLNLSLGIAWTVVENSPSLLAEAQYYLIQDLAARLGVPIEGFSNVSLAKHEVLTVSLPSFSGDDEVHPATQFRCQMKANSDSATYAAVKLFQELKVTTLPLPLTTDYLATACLPLGGCTDPSALSLVLQDPVTSSSGASSLLLGPGNVISVLLLMMVISMC